MTEKNDISSEPMDIDLSGQSITAMDISYNDSVGEENFTNNVLRSPSIVSISPKKCQLHYDNTCRDGADIPIVDKPTVKYCHIKLKRPYRGYKKYVFKIIVTIIVAIISIATYHMHSLKCCDQLNVDIFNEILKNKLYGQTSAVNLIIQTLKIKTTSKILLFSGGTGVGKTYASSLLLDYFGTCSNTYHYTMPTFETVFSPDLMFGLTLCKSSVVVVDDLTVKNIYVKDQIKNLIEKSKSLEKEIIVILIYNSKENQKEVDSGCNKLFNANLFDIFSDVEALKTVISFEPLSVENLKQCILQELGNKTLSDLQFETILKNFNVSVDGCKGVHSKIKYLSL